jgi:integrase
MPRARTGTIVLPGADGLWRARVTKPDGSRPLYSLGTTDKGLARRRLARLVEAIARGDDVLDAAEAASAPERVKDYAEAWLERREKQGIAKAPDERGILTNHVLPAIGRMPLSDVRPSHVRCILDEVAAKGRKRGTVEQVRGVLRRMFAEAWRAEVIESNPVDRVRLPAVREVRKERVSLTDDEFSRFIACAAVDLELRMLALVARCEGGMRTGDLHRWDWSMIDRIAFAECFVPRAKTRTPQRLAIPSALAPFVRAWWERAGKPESGPVFPVTRGKRAGQARGKGTHAARLRRELFRAGVYRMAPVAVPATSPGTRTDLGKSAAGTKLAPNARDPLYYETEVTLPVDFHSFRRAFASALAEAGVNVQHAMRLTAHSDPKVHARYVMATEAMRAIPDAALPALPVRAFADVARAAGNVTARDETLSRSVLSVERETGFEPATSTLAMRGASTQGESLRDVEHAEGDATVDHDAACFTVSPDDSSRNVTSKRAERTEPVTIPGDDDPAPDSTRDLERAIVAATLAGRHETAALLADRLRERLARDRCNVVRLDERERKR